MRAAAASIVVCILGAASFGCRAANADDSTFQGVFSNPTQSEESIKAGIESAVKDFNFITRPIARSRLKQTNSVLKRVAISVDGKMVSIALGASKPTITEPGRSSVKWTREDGEVFDVSTEWQGSALVQRFATKDGQRENRFSVSPDGATLSLQVIVSSPQLKVPVRYQLTFRREAGN